MNLTNGFKLRQQALPKIKHGAQDERFAGASAANWRSGSRRFALASALAVSFPHSRRTSATGCRVTARLRSEGRPLAHCFDVRKGVQ